MEQLENKVKTECAYCKNTFLLYRSKVTRAEVNGRKLFCNRQCHNDYKRLVWRKTTLNCSECSKPFPKKHGLIRYQNKKSNRLNGTDKSKVFCSTDCFVIHREKNLTFSKLVTVSCTWCKKDTEMIQGYAIQSDRHFCDRSCHGKYFSQKSMLGGNRSMLELKIEQHIRTQFPDLPFMVNDRSVLGQLELDFYFPTIRKAIEINGPAHYKVVYSEETFKMTKRNDWLKRHYCMEKGIEILIITDLINYETDNTQAIFDEQVKPFLSESALSTIK